VTPALQYTGDPDQRGCQLNRIAHHCIGRTRFSDLSSPSFLSGELVGSIPKLLCRDPLLAEMVQYAAQSRQARQYVFAEPALGDGPNVLPSDPAALDQACRRVLIADDNGRIRRVEGLIELGLFLVVTVT